MIGAGKVSGIVLVALVMVALGLYFGCTGPHHLEQYPAAATSPYKLPWQAGIKHFCVQSNRGIVSHRGYDEFAYDFSMPVGTELCAARAGKVTQVVQNHDGHGYHWPNNVVRIQHEDGTLACYAHIKKEGSRVQAGDEVKQGQVIALSGHVGNSMLPHVHFHVTDAERTKTLPLSFSDVADDAGVPRMFSWYTSGNTPPGDAGSEPVR